MATKKRNSRKPESLAKEEKSRNEVVPFLEKRGFAVEDEKRKTTGIATQQIVKAVDPDGAQLKIQVKLCLGDIRGASAALFGDINSVAERDTTQRASHTLIVQREEDGAIYNAALVPTEALVPIWKGQREVCDKLLAKEKLGRITKNFIDNGQRPTIYLQDTRKSSAREITDVLWNWPGVLDLGKLPIVSTGRVDGLDDTYQDLDIDLSLLGNDGAPRFVSEKSNVKRDLAVRRAVIQRATNGCERASCPDDRHYSGFLDVHHILGADKSDRVWTCVALCPNCHRAAHYGPDCDTLNKELLDFASQFRPTPQT